MRGSFGAEEHGSSMIGSENCSWRWIYLSELSLDGQLSQIVVQMTAETKNAKLYMKLPTNMHNIHKVEELRPCLVQYW